MTKNDVQAVILAGGQGTRLRPLTDNIPKPLLPILGKPCIDYILTALSDAGIREVFVTCGYRAKDMMDALGDGSRYGLDIKYTVEEKPAGTAGAVKLLEKELNGTFVVASGDVLADVDINALIEGHHNSNAKATMALAKVEHPEEFGIVGLDKSGMVERFKEKPKKEEVFSNLINAGIYVMEPDVLSKVPAGQMYDFSKQLFPMFLESNCLIHGSPLEGLWKDIGRPSDLLDANIRMADRKGSSICVGGARCSGRIVASLMQAENALIEGPAYIGYGATLGKETMLSSSAVGDGANIGDECKINGSFLMERCNLGRRCNCTRQPSR